MQHLKRPRKGSPGAGIRDVRIRLPAKFAQGCDARAQGVPARARLVSSLSSSAGFHRELRQRAGKRCLRKRCEKSVAQRGQRKTTGSAKQVKCTEHIAKKRV